MNPDPRPAPHDSGDDPRVDVLAEGIVGYANWHRYSHEGRDAARLDARGLLSRLDAARDRLVDITIVEPAECAAHGGAADQCAQCVARSMWLDAAQAGDLAVGGRHDQTSYDAGYSDGASAVEARLDAAAPARDDTAVALPDPEGIERDGSMHWTVHDHTGDDEYGAEGETWTVQLDPAGVVHLDGHPIAPAADLARALLAAAQVRERLGATTEGVRDA